MNLGRYFKERQNKGPVRFVTEAEFAAALVRDGQDDKTAKMQAKLCRTLGSVVTIGGKRLAIRKGE